MASGRFSGWVTGGDAQRAGKKGGCSSRPQRPEWSSRYDRKLAARLRFAKLRHQAPPEDVDYRSERGLDRALFLKLIAGDWIDAHDNLVICGPVGVGKSWLACAVGHKACRDDRSVLYQRLPRLFTNLALARGDGRYARFTRKLGSVQLLILHGRRGWSRSTTTPATTCSKSSRTATAVAPQSSPANSRSLLGTRHAGPARAQRPSHRPPAKVCAESSPTKLDTTSERNDNNHASRAPALGCDIISESGDAIKS